MKPTDSQQWDYEVEEFCENDIANALYNVAAAIERQAASTHKLLYGLKYSESYGMSIAEAIEVSSKNISDGLMYLASAIELKSE